MKKSIMLASLLAVGLAFSGGVNATTATSSLNISASVITDCTVSTTGINFGNISLGQHVYANGDVTVNCADVTPYNIALDAGLHLIAGARYLESANGGAILYKLSAVSDFTTAWGDSDFAGTFLNGASLADTSDGSDQPHTVYGNAIRGGTIQPVGEYSDTVIVTVYY